MGPPTCHMGDEHSEITAIARGSVTRVTHSHFCYKKQSRAENLHRFKGRKVCFTRGLHVAYRRLGFSWSVLLRGYWLMQGSSSTFATVVLAYALTARLLTNT